MSSIPTLMSKLTAAQSSAIPKIQGDSQGVLLGSKSTLRYDYLGQTVTVGSQDPWAYTFRWPIVVDGNSRSIAKTVAPSADLSARIYGTSGFTLASDAGTVSSPSFDNTHDPGASLRQRAQDERARIKDKTADQAIQANMQDPAIVKAEREWICEQIKALCSYIAVKTDISEQVD